MAPTDQTPLRIPPALLPAAVAAATAAALGLCPLPRRRLHVSCTSVRWQTELLTVVGVWLLIKQVHLEHLAHPTHAAPRATAPRHRPSPCRRHRHHYRPRHSSHHLFNALNRSLAPQPALAMCQMQGPEQQRRYKLRQSSCCCACSTGPPTRCIVSGCVWCSARLVCRRRTAGCAVGTRWRRVVCTYSHKVDDDRGSGTAMFVRGHMCPVCPGWGGPPVRTHHWVMCAGRCGATCDRGRRRRAAQSAALPIRAPHSWQSVKRKGGCQLEWQCDVQSDDL